MLAAEDFSVSLPHARLQPYGALSPARFAPRMNQNRLRISSSRPSAKLDFRFTAFSEVRSRRSGFAWRRVPGAAAAYPHASYAGTTVARGALFGLAFLSPLGTAVAVGCFALASFLGPFGWVGLAAMLSTETPAGQATTMVLAVSIYSL